MLSFDRYFAKTDLKYFVIFATCILFSNAIPASDMTICKMDIAVIEDFDELNGSYESLPNGFAVSKDGVNLLSADSDDFATIHSGGTSQGACHPWNLGTNDLALGYQPTADEFSPGFFMVAVSNATGVAAKRINIYYEIVCLNNANRSSTLDLEYSVDGQTFVRLANTHYASPMTKDDDNVLAWKTSPRYIFLKLSNPLPNTARIWLRWFGDDNNGDDAGSGSRDEYGINNLSVKLSESAGTVVVIK